MASCWPWGSSAGTHNPAGKHGHVLGSYVYRRGGIDMTVACSSREIHRPHRADIPGDNRSDAVVESEVLVSHIGRLPGRVFTLEDAEAAGVVLMCPGHRARCVD